MANKGNEWGDQVWEVGRFTVTPKLWAPPMLMLSFGSSMPSPAPPATNLCDEWGDGGHARLVLDLLEQLLADEKGLDAFLNDRGHRTRDHESGVLYVQRVVDRHASMLELWFVVLHVARWKRSQNGYRISVSVNGEHE